MSTAKDFIGIMAGMHVPSHIERKWGEMMSAVRVVSQSLNPWLPDEESRQLFSEALTLELMSNPAKYPLHHPPKVRMLQP